MLALAVSLVSSVIYTLLKAVLILILDIWSCSPSKAFWDSKESYGSV